jgi:UDP-N-acetylmuramate dehydrogenase
MVIALVKMLYRTWKAEIEHEEWQTRNRRLMRIMVENEPLARHTSWRIGGPAHYYSEIANPDDLRAAITWAREHELPLFVLGSGSNVLVRDRGFPGLVIRYIARDWHIESEGQKGMLHVQAGAPMAGTARRISSLGWAGLEWAEGLPGTVGGAVFGNAGCYGGDIASVLECVWLLVDDTVEMWPVEKFAYGYRTSALKALSRQAGSAPTHPNDPPHPAAPGLLPIVLAANMRVTRADPAELVARMARTASERKAKTPWGRSCGSVFKNPPGMSAGQLIDKAGMKGKRIGAVEVSAIHANYFVNLGGASSDDVLRLIDLVRDTVLRDAGVELELEIQIV